MIFIRIFLAAAIAAAALFACPQPAQAAPGIPGSPDFGYGARLELDGLYLEDALNLAADLSLDWLAVTISWAQVTTQNNNAVDRLDQVMRHAARLGIPVLASISHPPTAALSPAGPDPDAAASFITGLVMRYPAVLAVELFPAANTAAGWGAAPNPVAYASLYRTARAALDRIGSPVLLVAAGLRPILRSQGHQDLDDLEFLQGLYDSGLIPPVIGLSFGEMTSDPLSSPAGGERRILRHYEEIRAVMLRNHHDSGLLWITSISSPSGTISPSDKGYLDIQSQVSWLLQAFVQLRSQLYIGVTFFNSLNPPAGTTSSRALIINDQEYHPFTSRFRDLVSQNSTGEHSPQNGRPKDKALDKRRT